MSLGIEGDLTLRVRAGMDPAAAQAMRNLGVEVYEAVPVDSSFACPNGSSPEEITELEFETTGPPVQRYYCFDYLKFSASASVGLDLPGGSINFELMGQVKAVDVNGAISEWNPFGFEFIGISQLTLKLGVSVEMGPPVGVAVTLGFAGQGRFLDKNIFLAAQFGAKFLPNPPWVIPQFDGLRVSLPDGIELQDLVDIANLINEVGAAAAGNPAPDPIVLDGLPNIALKNLDFSISPSLTGVPDLCIPEGLVIGADLYLDPLPPTGEIKDLCTEPPPEPCSERQDEGCFASARLEIGLGGIFANAFLGQFNVGPLYWDNAELDIAISIPDTHFRLSGGASIQVPEGTVLAGGELAIELDPLNFAFFGRVEIFGFSALVDGKAGLGDLTNPSPELSLHVLLAADGAEVGEPNFNTLISAVATPPLEVFRSTVILADGILDDVATGDVAEVVLNLPDRLEDAGILPANCSTNESCDFHWIFDVRDNIQPVLDVLPTDLLPKVVEFALNGVELDIAGVPSTVERICFIKNTILPGFVYDGVCYNTVLGDFAGGLGEFRNVCLGIVPAAGEPGAGGCWVIPPIEIRLFNNPSLCDNLFPASQYPGLRDANGKCQFEGLVNAVLIPLLDDLIQAGIDAANIDYTWPGIDAIRTAIVDQLRNAETLFEFECLEFDLVLTPAQQSIMLGAAAIVYDADLAFQIGWDFALPAIDNLGNLIDGIFGSFLGNPPQDVCEGINTEVFNSQGGGTFEPPEEPAQVGGTLPSSIPEGSPVTFSGTFDKATEEARTVTIDWG